MCDGDTESIIAEIGASYYDFLIGAGYDKERAERGARMYMAALDESIKLSNAIRDN